MPKIILQNVRCSYVYVNDTNKHGKYGIQILIPKNDPQVKKFDRLVDEALVEKFGADAAKKRKRYKLPLRDGDEEMDGEEYEGMYFLNANNTRKPGIVNKANEPADEDDIEEYCYSGAYFHVSVNLYGFDTDGNKGVAAGLSNVMLRKKADRLDGSVSATSDFSGFASDDFDDDDDLDL